MKEWASAMTSHASKGFRQCVSRSGRAEGEPGLTERVGLDRVDDALQGGRRLGRGLVWATGAAGQERNTRIEAASQRDVLGTVDRRRSNDRPLTLGLGPQLLLPLTARQLGLQDVQHPAQNKHMSAHLASSKSHLPASRPCRASARPGSGLGRLGKAVWSGQRRTGGGD